MEYCHQLHQSRVDDLISGGARSPLDLLLLGSEHLPDFITEGMECPILHRSLHQLVYMILFLASDVSSEFIRFLLRSEYVKELAINTLAACTGDGKVLAMLALKVSLTYVMNNRISNLHAGFCFYNRL